MSTHLHIVIAVSGDPDPDKILGDLKAYGSRRLNRISTNSTNQWWTEGGSKRKLPDEDSIEAAVEYIRLQSNPLLLWTRQDGRVDGPHRAQQ
jgi:hypothetical protein